MRVQFRKYGKEALDAIDVGDEIWSRAIDEFKMTSIEASTFVLELSAVDEKLITKNFNLSRAKLGAWAKPNQREDAVVLESNSRDVVKFIVAELNKEFGIEEKKLSFKERLELHRAQSSEKNSL